MYSRPKEPMLFLSKNRQEKASDLISKYGRNSFSWQILNPGTSLWFSKDEKSVVGYVLKGKTRVTAGAPVTHPSNLKRAASEFEEDARKHGQSVCYFGAEGWLKDIFKNESTHRTLLLGAQPVWNPRYWQKTEFLKSRVREMTRRAAAKKVTVKETPPETVKNSQEHKECLEEWLRTRKLPILRFLINPDILENTSGRRFFSARKNEKLISFLSLARVPGRNGWLVEHIFRGKNDLKGTSELLMDFAVKTVAEEGAAHATLGLSPLSKHAKFSYAMNPAWVRIVFNWLYFGASCFYNFKGLDAFKSKFAPHRWEPVYAIVNKPRFCLLTFYRIAGAFCGTSPLLFGINAFLRAAAE